MQDCCKKFSKLVEEGWITTWKDRKITIDFYDGFQPKGHKTIHQDFIQYCPFCGTKL